MSDHRPKAQAGDIYGHWRVLYVPCQPKQMKKWLCQCSCLTVREVDHYSILHGLTQSCGCLSPKKTSDRCFKPLIHVAGPGSPHRSEYNIWHGLRSRCKNPKEPAFPKYGGRGITVCEAWDQSFEQFLADVGQRPSPKHTIDRIDNDRGYEPGNVRWSTRKEQNRNRRDNRYLCVDGQRRTLAEWSEITGLHVTVISDRLKAGWSVRDAVMNPRVPAQDRGRRTCEIRWGQKPHG